MPRGFFGSGNRCEPGSRKCEPGTQRTTKERSGKAGDCDTNAEGNHNANVDDSTTCGIGHRPPQAGARFVPNRSADIGTGAEPTQTRGLAECWEPNLGLAMGQLARRRQGRFVAGEQVRKEQGTLHEPERRSPTRLVSVHGPNARLFEAVGASHDPGNSDGAVGARFVPNRSADAGTGAEPTQRRGLAERCELRQLALRRQGKFMAGEQVQMEQEASHEPDYCGTKRLTPARSPFCSADGSTGLTTHSAKRGEGETVAASERIGNVGFTPVQRFNARIFSG
jgi:hypothetical protein